MKATHVVEANLSFNPTGRYSVLHTGTQPTINDDSGSSTATKKGYVGPRKSQRRGRVCQARGMPDDRRRQVRFPEVNRGAIGNVTSLRRRPGERGEPYLALQKRLHLDEDTAQGGLMTPLPRSGTFESDAQRVPELPVVPFSSAAMQGALAALCFVPRKGSVRKRFHYVDRQG